MHTHFRLCLYLFWIIGVVWLFNPTPALADTIPENDDNNTAQTAQLLTTIGLDSPVAAAINVPGDQDWYKFEVITGRTYVIEVYNLDVGLGRANGYNCYPYGQGYTGLGLIVYDTSVTEVDRQCSPVGGGNVQNSFVLVATQTGIFYLRVLPQSSASNVSGSYFLRILPKHDEPGANWELATFEPNNRLALAYEIRPGLNNVLTSSIEAQNIAFTTSFVDIDTYRINAVQGRTYVIELFNVATTLVSDTGYTCYPYGSGYKGLALELYKPDRNLALQKCNPLGAGDVHNILKFTAESDGPYYVRVYPNANTQRTFGDYSIRVLPKFDEPDAAWNSVTFEPNNQASNAYPISIGRLNAISSTIEGRSVGYATNFTDIDWYYFQGEADKSYVVELFNVESSLGTQGGYNCYPYGDGYRGLALFIYSPVRDEPISGQCAPTGHANVHSIASFTADASGMFKIQVYANSSNVTGFYQLRVLPSTGEPSASWDIALEPNNGPFNPYPLQINPCGVRTTIEPRRPSYLTNRPDIDGFGFNVVQNEQYKVSLSDIEATLQIRGLLLRLYNREGKELQRKTIKTAGDLTFTAGYTGGYGVTVYPENESSGVPSNSNGFYRITISKTLSPGCDGSAPPPAAVEGAISTAPNVDGRLTIVLPRGGNRALTIKIRTQCSNAQNIQLFIGTKTFAMTAVSESLYQVTINVPGDLPTSGSLEISAHYFCSGQLHIVPIAPTLEFHDPSGQITDAETGQPITNAIVTLYRVPNALPDLPGQTRDCRIVDTRGGNNWNNLPTAEIASGTKIDPLADALNDLQQINPQANPQITGSEGRYAWDVVEGCWFVVVEATGYARKVSPLVGVPPAVTDLNLQLNKAANVIYLPLVRR